MKRNLSILLLVFSSLLLNGQEISLHSSLAASAGNNEVLNPLNISKWRLGEVHLVVLDANDQNNLQTSDWDITSYPNPFTDVINLQFTCSEKSEFTIEVTDITGKKQLLMRKTTVFPNQNVQLDLSFLSPATYLLVAYTQTHKAKRVIKVQKN